MRTVESRVLKHQWEKYQNRLLSVLEKLVGALGKTYQGWYDQVVQSRPVDPAFRKWLENQIAYHGEKDGGYAACLAFLLEK